MDLKKYKQVNYNYYNIIKRFAINNPGDIFMSVDFKHDVNARN